MVFPHQGGTIFPLFSILKGYSVSLGLLTQQIPVSNVQVQSELSKQLSN